MEYQLETATKPSSNHPGCFAIFCLWSSIGLTFCLFISLTAVWDLGAGDLMEALFGLVIWGALAAIPIGLIELIGGLNQYARSRLPQLGYYLTFSGLYLFLFFSSMAGLLNFGNPLIDSLALSIPVALSWFLCWINYRVLPGTLAPTQAELEDILDA
ncbi:MAG: hypothetical protein AAF433_13080 [Bacteroidota bacterium]